MIKNRFMLKRMNNLNGKDWLRYSISVWDDISKDAEERKVKHPAMFPKEIPRRFIRIFLNEKQAVVLDPFVGAGSTLIASEELGKNGIGFEIADEYVDITMKRFKELFNAKMKQKIYNKDARKMCDYLKKESVDLCITSPPYWNILNEKRTVDKRNIKAYSKKNGNLGEIHDYKTFLDELKKIFEKVFIVLKSGAYCIVNVMDIRKKNEFYSFHIDVVRFMQEIGFILDDIIIWDRRRDYNNLKPLGYPFVFRVNKVHEYLLIFQKPKKEIIKIENNN